MYINSCAPRLSVGYQQVMSDAHRPQLEREGSQTIFMKQINL